jgi:hypothetical protein
MLKAISGTSFQKSSSTHCSWTAGGRAFAFVFGSLMCGHLPVPIFEMPQFVFPKASFTKSSTKKTKSGN